MFTVHIIHFNGLDIQDIRLVMHDSRSRHDDTENGYGSEWEQISLKEIDAECDVDGKHGTGRRQNYQTDEVRSCAAEDISWNPNRDSTSSRSRMIWPIHKAQ